MHILAGAAVLFALTAVPSTMTAQQVLQPVRVTAEADRAEQLAAEAFSVAATPTQFRKAGRLYERAAAARSSMDPHSAVALRKAAVSHYYGGSTVKSAELMERSADRAIQFGDVVSAANSYLDAAFIVQGLRQGQRATDLARRAQLLTVSPLLSDAQRSALVARIAGGTNVAALK
jgi:hypothetical protein